MAELIDIYTEEGKKIGTITKKEYYSGNIKNVPWIKCCICFVVDDSEQKVLFQKRGKCFLDPGKLDLCSGHVSSGQVPTQAMVRELQEELSIDEKDSRNLYYLGNINVDYTILKDETNQKDLKSLTSVFALKMKDISKIQVDNEEAISMGWLSLEDAVAFISNNMTRIPYEETLKEEYDKIFQNLREYINPRKKEKLKDV